MNLPSLSLLSAVWGVAELGLAIKSFGRSGGKSGSASKDRGSMFLIWGVCILCVWLGIYAANHWHGWEIPSRRTVYLTGYGMFVFGVLFRWGCIFYLGRFFTPNVVIQEQHRLIDTGPYRFIRHPTYTGALVAAFGVTLTMGNWLSLLIIFLPVLAVVLWRIRIEEAALLEAFGEQYRGYMQKTTRLIPLIY